MRTRWRPLPACGVLSARCLPHLPSCRQAASRGGLGEGAASASRLLSPAGPLSAPTLGFSACSSRGFLALRLDPGTWPGRPAPLKDVTVVLASGLIEPSRICARPGASGPDQGPSHFLPGVGGGTISTARTRFTPGTFGIRLG